MENDIYYFTFLNFILYKFTVTDAQEPAPMQMSTVFLIDFMCPGVVPQQPPIIETPASINAKVLSSKYDGDSG